MSTRVLTKLDRAAEEGSTLTKRRFILTHPDTVIPVIGATTLSVVMLLMEFGWLLPGGVELATIYAVRRWWLRRMETPESPGSREFHWRIWEMRRREIVEKLQACRVNARSSLRGFRPQLREAEVCYSDLMRVVVRRSISPREEGAMTFVTDVQQSAVQLLQVAQIVLAGDLTFRDCGYPKSFKRSLAQKRSRQGNRVGEDPTLDHEIEIAEALERTLDAHMRLRGEILQSFEDLGAAYRMAQLELTTQVVGPGAWMEIPNAHDSIRRAMDRMTEMVEQLQAIYEQERDGLAQQTVAAAG